MCEREVKHKVKYSDYDTPQEVCPPHPQCHATTIIVVFLGLNDFALQFLDDFDLIISNCEQYNGPDSDLMEQANQLEEKFKELCSEYLPDDSDYSRLERIPSDADSSEESEESTRDNNPEQEGELDQSLSTEIGEDDEDWTPTHSSDEN